MVRNRNPLVTVRQKSRAYVTARIRENEALEDLRQAIRDADDEGVPRTHIVADSGLARQTVYNILNAER